jgi:chemotaxis protein CheZ
MHGVVTMSAAVENLDTEMLEKNLKDLFNYIQRVRQEIAALNRSADDADKFATMGDQLDGIIEATKDATDTIMEAVEKNSEAVGKLKEATTDADQIALLDQIQNNNNAVFEACAFQDLTGQRVTKIIKSVTYVEARVDALREIWGKEELDKVKIESDHELTEDEKLLHGPQRKAEAISQDEIDKLFD